MKAPKFWDKKSWQAFLLYPLSLIYGRISLSRFYKRFRYSAHIPVLCIGNLVAGGAGKTPTALTLGKCAHNEGYYPIFLTRGYGGTQKGPLVVDIDNHCMNDVGDEALLLARNGPTIVSADRAAGAKLAESIAPEGTHPLIIMDDGFQNPYLYKDYSLIVIDAEQGIGNGFLIPSGPLRAPLRAQVQRADHFLVIGNSHRVPSLRQLAAKLGKPSSHGFMRPARNNLLGGTRVLAFCGIGRPDKFVNTIKELELDLVDMVTFGDHHRYTDKEAREVLERAEAQNLIIVTTTKDHVRLSHIGESGKRLAEQAHIIDIEVVFDDPDFAALIFKKTARKFSRHS